MIYNSLFQLFFGLLNFLNDINLGVLFFDNLQIFLLLQIILILFSLFFLLNLGNLIQTSLYNCIDLSSYIAFSQVIFFEMNKQVSRFLSMAFEKSNHFQSILRVQLSSIWKIVNDFIVLTDLVYVGKTHVAEINPFYRVQAQPFTNLSPVSKLFRLFVGSGHLCNSQEIVFGQTGKDEINVLFFSQSVIKIHVVFICRSPNSVLYGLVNIV